MRMLKGLLFALGMRMLKGLVFALGMRMLKGWFSHWE